jgi:hypothetical protein
MPKLTEEEGRKQIAESQGMVFVLIRHSRMAGMKSEYLLITCEDREKFLEKEWKTQDCIEFCPANEELFIFGVFNKEFLIRMWEELPDKNFQPILFDSDIPYVCYDFFDTIWENKGEKIGFLKEDFGSKILRDKNSTRYYIGNDSKGGY